MIRIFGRNELREKFLRDAVRMATLLENGVTPYAESLYVSIRDFFWKHETELGPEYTKIFLEIENVLAKRTHISLEQFVYDLTMTIGARNRL